MNNQTTRVLDARGRNGSGSDRFLLSIVTPAYNEADNLSVFYERLRGVLDDLGIELVQILGDVGHSCSSARAIGSVFRLGP